MHGLVSAATAASNNGGGSIGGFLIPLILVLAVVYIFSMQRRRTKAQQEQVSKLAPGSLVITTAGLYATVVELEEGDVLLEIAPDVVCRFTRSAVARVVSAPDQDGQAHGDAAHDGDEHETDEHETDEQGVGEQGDGGDEAPGAGAETTAGESGRADGADGPTLRKDVDVSHPPHKEH
ncbi:Preprotein translocase subunit YajC [Frankia canadensis]|uniref:Preprotein translocase subunit YajC n=1 Tax=Frankia canadensis TaxID=1836972 RepID=A0A2I2KYK5_9ACTN|nr:preprotein translocase subunit YajC [Frankia canadensis]SNQ50752.1 Preprotein translocase subunit YajC [Frankia canadensis]SOU58042.1 Preprotein translocase subunit YajC [Frankia canadensis]